MPKLEGEVEVLDSKSPEARKATLVVHDRISLRFSGTNEQHQLVGRIRSVEQLPDYLEVYVESPIEPDSIWQIRVRDFSLAETVSDALNQSLRLKSKVWLNKLRSNSPILACLMLIVGLVGLLVGAVKSSEYVHYVTPRSFDIDMGDKVDSQLKGKFEICKNKVVDRSLNYLLNVLVPEGSKYPYKITVIENQNVAGFVIPNGHIFLTSGLIFEAESIEEVASVIAHEIAHVENRHSTKRFFKTLGTFTVLKLITGGGSEGTILINEQLTEIAASVYLLRNTRGSEREADEMGLKILEEQRINPKGFEDFFDRLVQKKRDFKKNDESLLQKSLDWMSTHPPSEERAELARENIEAQKGVSFISLGAKSGWSSWEKKCSS